MFEFCEAKDKKISNGAKKIGLIAGNGHLPIIWAKNAKKAGMEVTAIAFRQETEKCLGDYVDRIHWVNLGQLSHLLNVIKAEEIQQAVMIGQVRPIPFLFKSLFSKDTRLRKILDEVEDKRGNSLLAAFARCLEEEGVNLLDSRTFIADYLPKAGKLTNVDIDEGVRKDIDFGFKLAKQTAALDIGQTVVIKDLTVVAVEAIEGTNRAVLRGAKLGGSGIVVVKASNPGHDMRFDIPVVGPKTIYYLDKAKAKALAIEAGRTLIVDKEKALKMAERKKIAVVAL